MRILGFSVDWPKLEKPEFTTFRYPRKDSDKGRDWHETEEVQIVVHPRSKDNRVRKGNAVIISKQPKHVFQITEAEAQADGFEDFSAMMDFLNAGEPNILINKLTIRWTRRYDGK